MVRGAVPYPELVLLRIRERGQYMIDSDTTWNQLVALVVEATDKVHGPQDVRPESRLLDDLGISSLMAVNLVMELEREFDIIIIEQDFDHIETVGDLKLLVDGKRAGMTQ